MISEQISIDKSDWTPVKFGDIVFEPKESSKDPKADGIEHVVGLEHIESEDINLRHSANLDTSTTFSKRYAAGDVLFGRRRAYLKKAAQAKFSGICSGDITVLRAKDNLIPELLPFIVQNDKFFDYAIKHSAGGLSPRVKFKDLANYKFLLPPKDQQAQLAELLWAMDEVIEREKMVLKNLQIFGEKKKLNHFKNVKGKRYNIGEIAEVRAGVGFPLKFQGLKNEEINFFKVGDMNTMGNERYMHISNNTISSETLKKLKGKVHKKGTVVFPKVGAAIATEKKRILLEDSVVDNNTMGITLLSNLITPEYLHSYFDSILLEQLSNAGAVPSINAKIIKNISLIIPTEKVLIEYLSELEKINKNTNSLIKKISSSKALQKSLINQVF